MRPRSLRAIMVIYVTAFLVVLLVIRGLNYTITHDALGREVDRRLASESDGIIAAGHGTDTQAMAARIAAEQGEHDTADLYFLLVDRQGRRLAGNLDLYKLPPAGFSDFGREGHVRGVAHGRVLTRRLADGAALVIVSDNDVVDGFDTMLFRVQLFGLFVTALVIVGGATAITLTIRGRMRAMQRTVDAVIDGDLHSRIPVDGSRSEFDRQAEAFNRMLDRIDALMTNIKHATKDVTP